MKDSVKKISKKIDYEISEASLKWGPSYKIIFEVRITSFSGQLVYFGKDDGNGNLVPSVVAKNDKLIITTFVHGKEYSISSNELQKHTKYTVTISQGPSSGNSKQVDIMTSEQSN